MDGADGALLRRFRRRFLLYLGAAGWLPAAVLAWAQGWRAGVACLATTALVGADFLWISLSFAPLFAPGEAVPKRAAGRALVGMGARMALLLIGLYAILRVLPGQAGAAAAGMAAPLVFAAAAGLTAAKG